MEIADFQNVTWAFKMSLHEKWLHVSATCNQEWKVRWHANVDGGRAFTCKCKWKRCKACNDMGSGKTCIFSWRREWKWKQKIGLNACADGEWDRKHVIAFVRWDVKCCGIERWKWNVMMLLHKMEDGVKWNVLKFLVKNLQLLQNEEKSKSKQANNKNKHKTNTCLWS